MCRSQNTPTLRPLGCGVAREGGRIIIIIIIIISHRPKSTRCKNIYRWQQDLTRGGQSSDEKERKEGASCTSLRWEWCVRPHASVFMSVPRDSEAIYWHVTTRQQKRRACMSCVFAVCVCVYVSVCVCVCVCVCVYLLGCVTVNHVRHERDLPVQQGGRSQVQWNLVCHHHCDVHSWRNSLNCPTWEREREREREGEEQGTYWQSYKHRKFFVFVFLLPHAGFKAIKYDSSKVQITQSLWSEKVEAS